MTTLRRLGRSITRAASGVLEVLGTVTGLGGNRRGRDDRRR